MACSSSRRLQSTNPTFSTRRVSHKAQPSAEDSGRCSGAAARWLITPKRPGATCGAGEEYQEKYGPHGLAAHQDRIYQRLQAHEMQREMQHAAAGVRSGLAALRHHVLVPTGQFFGGDSTAFFDVRYARSGAVAHRHIGAACWLVTARLYNLKRPKSQFWSTVRAFCMTGIFWLLASEFRNSQLLASSF